MKKTLSLLLIASLVLQNVGSLSFATNEQALTPNQIATQAAIQVPQQCVISEENSKLVFSLKNDYLEAIQSRDTTTANTLLAQIDTIMKTCEYQTQTATAQMPQSCITSADKSMTISSLKTSYDEALANDDVTKAGSLLNEINKISMTCEYRPPTVLSIPCGKEVEVLMTQINALYGENTEESFAKITALKQKIEALQNSDTCIQEARPSVTIIQRQHKDVVTNVMRGWDFAGDSDSIIPVVPSASCAEVNQLQQQLDYQNINNLGQIKGNLMDMIVGTTKALRHQLLSFVHNLTSSILSEKLILGSESNASAIFDNFVANIMLFLKNNFNAPGVSSLIALFEDNSENIGSMISNIGNILFTVYGEQLNLDLGGDKGTITPNVYSYIWDSEKKEFVGQESESTDSIIFLMPSSASGTDNDLRLEVKSLSSIKVTKQNLPYSVYTKDMSMEDLIANARSNKDGNYNRSVQSISEQNVPSDILALLTETRDRWGWTSDNGLPMQIIDGNGSIYAFVDDTYTTFMPAGTYYTPWGDSSYYVVGENGILSSYDKYEYPQRIQASLSLKGELLDAFDLNVTYPDDMTTPEDIVPLTATLDMYVAPYLHSISLTRTYDSEEGINTVNGLWNITGPGQLCNVYIGGQVIYAGTLGGVPTYEASAAETTVDDALTAEADAAAQADFDAKTADYDIVKADLDAKTLEYDAAVDVVKTLTVEYDTAVATVNSLKAQAEVDTQAIADALALVLADETADEQTLADAQTQADIDKQAIADVLALALVDAEAQVVDAETKVTDAQVLVTDAETKVADAQALVTDAETKVADAQALISDKTPDYLEASPFNSVDLVEARTSTNPFQSAALTLHFNDNGFINIVVPRLNNFVDALSNNNNKAEFSRRQGFYTSSARGESRQQGKEFSADGAAYAQDDIFGIINRYVEAQFIDDDIVIANFYADPDDIVTIDYRDGSTTSFFTVIQEHLNVLEHEIARIMDLGFGVSDNNLSSDETPAEGGTPGALSQITTPIEGALTEEVVVGEVTPIEEVAPVEEIQ